MARKLRVQYLGAIYHVINRGDRRESIFRDDLDREQFVQTLAETCAKTGWQVHGFCLMPNHFHLVVETPRANLVMGMKWFLGTYTSRFNRRHKLVGHLFSGRYKAMIVDGSGTGYLKEVCDYVHLNPVRARLLPAEKQLREYQWSSWREYLNPPGRRPQWLRVDRLLGEYRIPQDSRTGRRQLERAVEERRQGEGRADYGVIRKTWFLGDDQFKEEVIARVSEELKPHHFGEERAEGQAEVAERIVREELGLRKWDPREMERRAKGDLEKVKIAHRLRQETMMTIAWIARRLAMGTAAYVNNRLYLWRHGRLKD
jgi:putative transposase